MKKLKPRWILAALGILAALTLGAVTRVALAAGQATGTQIVAVALNGTVAWFTTSSDIGGTRPSCHTANQKRDLVFDPTTTWGKVYLPLVQAAFLSGKRVDISGAGACLNLGTTPIEKLQYIKVYD
jgi:hypothetical protein